MTVTNVNRTDSGEYRCVANNILGNETSDVATLDVQCKYSPRLFTVPYFSVIVDDDRLLMRAKLGRVQNTRG